MSNVATSIRETRKAQNLRLADVAAAASCSVSLVSMVESGYKPGFKARKRIGDALGASAGYFWPTN